MKTKSFVYIILLLVAFYSLKPWIFHYLDLRLELLFGPIVLLLFFFCKDLFTFKGSCVLFSILAILARINEASSFSIKELVFIIIITSGIIAILALKIQYKLELLELFDKTMLIIVVPGILLWILYLIGIPLPHEIHSWDVGFRNEIVYDNYYLFITTIGYSSFIPRFQSVFYEPGFFSLILLFLIAYRRFDFKNVHVIVYTIAIILSFSLAGFLLFAFMWIVQTIFGQEKPKMLVIVVCGIIIGAYVFFSNFNHGDNAVNNMIIARMEIEDGQLVRYNRTKEDYEVAFERFITEGGIQLITGKNRVKSEDLVGSVDWTVYWYRNGIIGLTLILLIVLIAVSPYRKSRYALMHAALLLIVFARGIGVMWMSAFWLVYLCGIASLYDSDILFNKRHNKLLEKSYAKQT